MRPPSSGSSSRRGLYPRRRSARIGLRTGALAPSRGIVAAPRAPPVRSLRDLRARRPAVPRLPAGRTPRARARHARARRDGPPRRPRPPRDRRGGPRRPLHGRAPRPRRREDAARRRPPPDEGRPRASHARPVADDRAKRFAPSRGSPTSAPPSASTRSRRPRRPRGGRRRARSRPGRLPAPQRRRRGGRGSRPHRRGRLPRGAARGRRRLPRSRPAPRRPPHARSRALRAAARGLGAPRGALPRPAAEAPARPRGRPGRRPPPDPHRVGLARRRDEGDAPRLRRPRAARPRRAVLLPAGTVVEGEGAVPSPRLSGDAVDPDPAVVVSLLRRRAHAHGAHPIHPRIAYLLASPSRPGLAPFGALCASTASAAPPTDSRAARRLDVGRVDIRTRGIEDPPDAWRRRLRCAARARRPVITRGPDDRYLAVLSGRCPGRGRASGSRPRAGRSARNCGDTS
jgi:hypothetical protein